MKTYDWKCVWFINSPELREISRLSDELDKRLNSGLSGNIPKLAKALNTTEQKVAWALQDLCSCRAPEVLIDSDEGEQYFQSFIALRKGSPRPFTDEMEFYGRMMR